MLNENTVNAIKTIGQRGLIKLYGLGGAGMNICGSQFENYRHHEEPGMALVDTSYLDTSFANIKPNMPDDKVFIVPVPEGEDGSGKERKKNAKLIMKHIKEFLQKHAPGYINVIVSSASGGSGAVAAAILTNELLKMDQMVINITIGVADSGAEIKNTLDTLQSFEGLVSALGKTVPVAYFENSKDTPMSKVDEHVTELITAIAVVFSRMNEGLDTRDLYNFLNVERLTNYKPHAVGLTSYAGQMAEDDHRDTITVASAVTTKDNRGIDFIVPYSTYGVLPVGMSQEIVEQAPIHLATQAYPFNGISKRLKAFLAEMEKAANARTQQSEVLDGDEELEGGFLKL